MCRESSGQKACAALKFRCPPLLISPRTVPSSETAWAQTPAAAAGSHSHQGREGKKITFLWLWLHSRRTTYFSLCNLDFLILLLWLGGAWSLLMWQRLLWQRRTSSQARREKKKKKKSACRHQQKVVLELLLLTTLHRPGLSQSRTASNWQLFQRGEVTSVQMCLSSISCAHVYQCCPEITP